MFIWLILLIRLTNLFEGGEIQRSLIDMMLYTYITELETVVQYIRACSIYCPLLPFKIDT